MIEPVIDVRADKYNFGYRKGRNAHMAIGKLAKALQTKSLASRSLKHKKKNIFKKNYFSYTKFVIKCDIEDFFGSINHN